MTGPPRSGRPLRIGLIGAGFMTRTHTLAYKSAPLLAAEAVEAALKSADENAWIGVRRAET